MTTDEIVEVKILQLMITKLILPDGWFTLLLSIWLVEGCEVCNTASLVISLDV